MPLENRGDRSDTSDRRVIDNGAALGRMVDNASALERIGRDRSGGHRSQFLAVIERERLKDGLGTSLFSATGVTPGVYGSNKKTVVLTVDEFGRITIASEQTFITEPAQINNVTMDQGAGTIAYSGIRLAEYQRVGKWVRGTLRIDLAATTAGTTNTKVRVGFGSLPTAALSGRMVGNGWLVLAGVKYGCFVELDTTSAFVLTRQDTPTDFLGRHPNASLAPGDGCSLTFSYEAA